MGSAVSYNRAAIGRLWTLVDLPVEWPGYQILLKGDLDQDLVIDPEELDYIDWLAFSEAVEDFQVQLGLTPVDGKLGKNTLGSLRAHYGHPPTPDKPLKVLGGDLEFWPAETPTKEPPGPPLVGQTPEERRLVNLWNRYGGAIAQQAQEYDIPIETALAVFYVESGTAYDPNTGLVIIRFEPHIFRRYSGEEMDYDRGGQRNEWANLAAAYEVDPTSALLATSYGLPQLMGFNWKVTPHAGVREMVLAFQRSCVEQVAGFFQFVAKNNLLKFIRQKDWRAFTKGYNGPGNVDDYAAKLIRALKVVHSLKQDGAEFRG